MIDARSVAAMLGIVALVFGGTARAENRWTLSPGSSESMIRCDLGFADPRNPVRAFVSVVQMRNKQLAFMIRQPDMVYPEFVPYSVTLRSDGETLSFPAKSISSRFLSTGLNETTDPNHRIVPILLRSFDLLVFQAGKPYGPVQHVDPVPVVLGHEQSLCLRQASR